MRSCIHLLRRLVRESRYIVDQRAVADAILAHARAQSITPRGDVDKHLAWLEQQLKQFRVDNRG